MKINLNNKKFLILIVLICLVFVFLLIAKSQKLAVVTDKQEYNIGATFKIRIKNHFLGREICLSSCYPYFLEKKTNVWKPYRYQGCPFLDRIEKCLRPGETRAFETHLPTGIISGMYRFSIPICNDCGLGQEFQETDKFYSNAFTIR